MFYINILREPMQGQSPRDRDAHLRHSHRDVCQGRQRRLAGLFRHGWWHVAGAQGLGTCPLCLSQTGQDTHAEGAGNVPALEPNPHFCIQAPSPPLLPAPGIPLLALVWEFKEFSVQGASLSRGVCNPVMPAAGKAHRRRAGDGWAAWGTHAPWVALGARTAQLPVAMALHGGNPWGSLCPTSTLARQGWG